MKKLNKNSIIVSLVAVLIILGGVFNVGGLRNIFSRKLASASIYGTFVQSNGFAILAGSTITNTGNTVITGDLGLSPGTSITGFLGTVENDGPGIVTGSIHQTDATASTAQTSLTAAYNDTASQPCSANLTGQDLGGMTLTPGVYCFDTSAQLTGILTLNALGNPNSEFIFKIGTTLTTASGSSVIFTGGVGSSCNVFWQVGTSATIGSTTSFKGNIFALTAISTGNATTVNGRLLARNGAVTLINTAVTAPMCVALGTLHIIKHVINNNGGTAIASNSTINVSGTNVSSSSFAGSEAGVDVTLDAGAYVVTEPVVLGNYLESASLNCSGSILAGETKTCTITNDDIAIPTPVSSGGGGHPTTPPLIDLVKVPSPLALPNGPGPVTYTYTLRNIGTIPVTNITTLDDSCSPITLISGDINNDSRLDLNETWVYTCDTVLQATHTNTVTATGWANGMSAVDIASATVIVGVSIVPPLIHVTKIPSPLALPATGGLVTYTNKVTNPGIVPLHNVSLTDDKCGPVTYVSGDINNDSRLDVNETWTYTCQSNLTKTTTNTVTAEGTANGILMKDLAIATVVVGVPGLPQTGFPPKEFSN